MQSSGERPAPLVTSRALGYLAFGLAVALAAMTVFKHQRQRRAHEDECRRLDDELDDSFPASDPPSHSSPIGARVS